MRKNQKGFALAALILIIVTVLLLFGAGLLVWQANSKKTSDTSLRTQESGSQQTTSIVLTKSPSKASWSSSPAAPQGGYILYWARVGCLAKFGCVADESELKVKGYKVILDSSASSYDLGENNADIMALVCENAGGSCGIESNIVK